MVRKTADKKAVHQTTNQNAETKTAISKMQAEKMKQGQEWPLGNVYSRPARKAANAAPWKCNFDSAIVFTNNWVAIDKDGDAKTWKWNKATGGYSIDGRGKGGVMISSYNGDTLVKDFLITKNPVSLTAGKAYVVLSQTIQSSAYKEGIKVYYSKSFDTTCDVSNLTEIGHWFDSVAVWKLRNMSFNLAEAGDYYFYIEHYTKDKDQYNLVIDNFEVGMGDFVGKEELKWQSPVLPTSSCALGQENIGFMIKNVGTADLTNFTVKYSIDGNLAVAQTFAGPVKPYETEAFVFDTKADLSSSESDAEFGKKYEVTFLVPDADGKDEEMETAYVTNFKPLAALPYFVSMEADDDGELLMDIDTMLGYAVGEWEYDDLSEAMVPLQPGVPLMTRCMNLKKDVQYRFGYNYMAGFSIFGIFLMTDDYDILYGKVGTPMSEWDTLASYIQPYTQDAAVYEEFYFTVENDDAYAFAVKQRIDSVYPESNGSTIIYDMLVEEVPEHDIKLVAIGSSLARFTPIRHAGAPTFNAIVENRGYSDEPGVKVTVKTGETLVGEVTLGSDLASAEDTLLMINGQLENMVADQEVEIDIKASMTATDANDDNNELEWSFTPTDGLYAFDEEVEYDNGIGHSSYLLGQIYTLQVPDTLINVICGWYDLTEEFETDYEFPVAVEVYTLSNDGSVGKCILSHTFNRQIEGGYQTVNVPARALNAGMYFVCMRQLGDLNYALGYDNVPGGVVYVMDGGEVGYASSYGNMALRIKLGHPDRMVAKDIELLSISKPKETGLFTANEAIEVNYRNNGADAIEVSFKCTIDGVALEAKQVKVSGYGMGKLKFTADLSKGGRHDIVIIATTEGDENVDNNVVKKTVRTIYPTPYQMNFEFCADFAIDGDLTPWKGVDVDGDSTYGVYGATWKNAYAPQSYMAFNVVESGLTTFEARAGGDRVGTVWASGGNKKNDDWLISPKLRMPKTGSTLIFYVNSIIDAYGDAYVEKYEVYVSETDDQVASFKKIGDTRETVPGEWTKVEVDLSDYNDKDAHVAIRCISEDQWIFLIDDIEICNPAGIEQTTDLSAYVKAYPNPVTDIWTVSTYGVEINRVEIYNMLGEMVYHTAGNLKTDGWRLNMSGFKAGLYTARVYTSAGVQTIKVTVL